MRFAIRVFGFFQLFHMQADHGDIRSLGQILGYDDCYDSGNLSRQLAAFNEIDSEIHFRPVTITSLGGIFSGISLLPLKV